MLRLIEILKLLTSDEVLQILTVIPVITSFMGISKLSSF